MQFFHPRRPRCPILWLVASAGLRHPFPSRTRPLRAPAAMILRPGARESSAPQAIPPRGAHARHARAPPAFFCPNGMGTANSGFTYYIVHISGIGSFSDIEP